MLKLVSQYYHNTQHVFGSLITPFRGDDLILAVGFDVKRLENFQYLGSLAVHVSLQTQ